MLSASTQRALFVGGLLVEAGLATLALTQGVVTSVVALPMVAVSTVGMTVAYARRPRERVSRS